MANGPPQDPKQVDALSVGMAKLAEIQASIRDSVDEEFAQRQATAGLIEKLTDQEEKLLGITKDLRDARKEYIEQLEKGEDTSATEEKIRSLTKLHAITQKVTKATNDLQKSEDNFASSVHKSTTAIVEAATGIKSTGNALTGFVKQLGEGSKSGTLFNKVFDKTAVAVTGANLAFGVSAGVMSKFAEATLKGVHTNEQLLHTLGRDTGVATTRGQTTAILEMAQESENAAISQASLGAAIASLQVSTRGMFGNLAEGNMELAVFAENMRSTGVEVATSAELFEKFGMVLGHDIPAIQKLEENVVKLAKKMNMSSNDMVRDVAAMAESLAHFGTASQDIALDIAEIAAATKVGSQSIIKFTQSFEFMPDAIERANQLNIIFGKSVLNGQQMWQMMNDGTKGPGEAFKFALTSIGTEIDETFIKTPAKMRAFADALGVSSSEGSRLAKVMLQAKQDGKSLTEVVSQQTADYKENKEALAAVTNIYDQAAKFQEKFAVAIEPITTLVGGFLEMLNSAGPTATKVIATLVAGAFLAVGYAITRTIQNVRQLAMEMSKMATQGVPAVNQLTAAINNQTSALQRNATAQNNANRGASISTSPASSPAGTPRGGFKSKLKGGLGAGLAMGAMSLASTAMSGQEMSSKDIVKSIGGMLGGAGGWALGAALAPATGGLSLLIPMVSSMLGGIAADAVVDTMMDDFIVKGGQVIPINAADDIIGAKAGGVFDRTMGGKGGGTPEAVEIVVSLFGEELVRKLVDLVEEEQASRTSINNAIQGAK
jgi:hypothetical protein